MVSHVTWLYHSNTRQDSQSVFRWIRYSSVRYSYGYCVLIPNVPDVDGDSWSSSADVDAASGNFRFLSSFGTVGSHVVVSALVEAGCVSFEKVDWVDVSPENVDGVDDDVWVSEKGDCVERFSTLAMSSWRRWAMNAASISCWLPEKPENIKYMLEYRNVLSIIEYYTSL